MNRGVVVVIVEALGRALSCALLGAVAALAVGFLAAVTLAGCAPHDSPRRFGRQQPTPIGQLRVLYSVDLASRPWCDEAARRHWANAVGLQQVASSFGIGSVLNGSPTVYVVPGLSLDSPYQPQAGRRYRIDGGGAIWVAEGERSTLPDLTHALAHWYWQRAEDHSTSPTFWAVVLDTQDQTVRALRLARGP